MDREELFEAYLNDCEKSNPIQFPGLGNPNKDILIIGKESTAVSNNHIREFINLCRDKDLRDKPRKIKPENYTWRNYQLLFGLIYKRQSNYTDYWDFERECAFTTEMSNIPSKHSHLTKKIKEGIDIRIEFLKQSKFIQSFPVVILACSNYIRNDEASGYTINETFGVKFDNEPKADGRPIGAHVDYPKGFWYFTHHSNDGKKLVIHTIQLSQFYKPMLEDMAEEIRKHLNIK